MRSCYGCELEGWGAKLQTPTQHGTCKGLFTVESLGEGAAIPGTALFFSEEAHVRVFLRRPGFGKLAGGLIKVGNVLHNSVATNVYPGRDARCGVPVLTSRLAFPKMLWSHSLRIWI